MSNYVLSATLELKDQFTAQVNKARSGFKGLTETLKNTGSASDAAAAGMGKAGTAAVKAAGQADRAKRAFQGIRGIYEATIRAKDDATAKIQRVKTELNGLKGKAYTVAINVKQNGSFNNMQNKVSGMASAALMGTSMQMAGAAGIGFGIYDAVKGYMDFEQEMSAVKAISGATEEEFQRLNDAAMKMGAETKFSAKESAQALEYMGMAGWKTDEMIAGLPGVMNLAAASGEDLGRVSDIVTDAMTSFKLSASDAAMFADVLAATATSSNTNVGKMGYTFQYVAPLAGALGYTIQDTALAIGAMADAGIKGEQAGTSLRALLTRMASPTKDSAAAMAKLGLSVTDSTGKMRPLRDILADIRAGFKKLTPAEQAQVAADLAGQEAMSGLLGIVNETDDKYDSLAESIDKSTGAAKKMADIRMDNLAGDLEYLSGDWDAFTMSLMKGNASNGLREFVKEADKLLSDFSGNVEKNGLGVRSILALIGEGIKDLKDKFLAFDGIGSVLAGGALAVGLKKIYNLAMKVKDVIQGIPKNLPGGTPTGGNGLPSTSSVKDMVVTATNVIINSKGAPTTAPTSAPPTNAPVPVPEGTPKGTPKPGWGARLSSWAKRVPWIGSAIALGGTALDVAYAPEGEKLSTAGRDVAGLAGGFAGMKAGAALGAAAGSFIPGAGTAAGAIVGGIAGGIGGDIIGQKLAEAFQSINWDSFSQVINEKNAEWSQTFAQLGPTITSTFEGIRQSMSDTDDWLTGKQAELHQYMADSWEGIKQSGVDSWNMICQVADEKNAEWSQTFDGIRQSMSDTDDWLTEQQTELHQNMADSWEGIKQAGLDAWNMICQVADEKNAEWAQTFADAKESAGNCLAELEDSANTTWSDISSGASSLESDIASAFQSAKDEAEAAWDGVTGWFEENVWGPLSERARSAWSNLQTTIADIRSSASSFSFSIPSIFSGHATGSSFYAGGWTEINERGGEIVDLPQGSRIYPHATTERIIRAELESRQSSGSGPVVIKGNTFYVREEADIDRIAYKLAKLISQGHINYGGGY